MRMAARFAWRGSRAWLYAYRNLAFWDRTIVISRRALLSLLTLSVMLSISVLKLSLMNKKTSGNSLAQLLQLRQVDERYAVRAWAEEHTELLRNPRALSEYALNFATMGWFDDALKASGKALELAPNDDYVLASRALVLHQSKNSSALWAAKRLLLCVPMPATWQYLLKYCILANLLRKQLNCYPRLAREPESFDIVAASARISLVNLKGDEAWLTSPPI